MNPKRLRELVEKALNFEDYPDIPIAEPETKYHAFLGLLAQEMQPKRIVELGTYIGESTKYMARMAPDASIITIDINPDAKRQIEQIEPVFPNIIAITEDATKVPPQYDGQSIDILFIDINHDFSATHTAYEAWKDLVRSDGIIFVDDIHLDTETERFNQYLRDRNIMMIDLSPVHATGFGAIINA